MKSKFSATKTIDRIDVTVGKWRRCDELACRTCGEPAYLHPELDFILGCKKCEVPIYIHRANLFFRRIPQKKV